MERLFQGPTFTQSINGHATRHSPFSLGHGVDNALEFIKTTDHIHLHTITEIVTIMEAYLRRRRNPFLDRQSFHRRDQMSGESVDRYFAALKSLDDACDHDLEIHCEACNSNIATGCPACHTIFPMAKHLQEIRIRDRLICGLLDKEMQRKVLAEQYGADLTLEHVLSICTAVENSNTVGATLSNPPGSTMEIQAAAKNKISYKKQNAQQQNSSKTPNGQKSCSWCGKERHPKEQCGAKDHTCKFCNKVGHFKKVCWKKEKEGKEKTKPSDNKNTPSNNTATIATAKQLIQVPTTINGTTHLVSWLPDTGADITAISIKQLRKLGPSAKKALTGVKEDVVAANGSSLVPVGSVPSVTFSLNGRTYTTTVRVFKHVTTPMLSRDGCKALGLIDDEWPLSRITGSSVGVISTGKKEVQPIASPSTQNKGEMKQSIIEEFPAAFNDTVLRPMDGPTMKIKLIDGAVPCKRYKAHTIPYHWRDQVKAQLDSMVEKGIIEPVPVGEPVDWCHPMVVVPKKGSSEPRITVDLTGLNKFVRRPAYPVRFPREVVASIPPGNRYFTTLDARHGYWQVQLDDESKKLTSFITPWGSYRYLRNVMGLISAGDEHNRRGDEALQGIQNVAKIVEDILIYDKD